MHQRLRHSQLSSHYETAYPPGSSLPTRKVKSSLPTRKLPSHLEIAIPMVQYIAGSSGEGAHPLEKVAHPLQNFAPLALKNINMVNSIVH